MNFGPFSVAYGLLCEVNLARMMLVGSGERPPGTSLPLAVPIAPELGSCSPQQVAFNLAYQERQIRVRKAQLDRRHAVALDVGQDVFVMRVRGCE
jgi:hypothetical protein